MRTHFIYQPGQAFIKTSLSRDSDGTFYTDFTYETLPDGSRGPNKRADDYLVELNATRPPGTPEFQILEWDDIFPMIQSAEDAAYVRPWAEIDAERWQDMLEILPPCGWGTVLGVEIFHISEATTADIHAIFARLGDRYFEREARISTPREDFAREVLALAAA